MKRKLLLCFVLFSVVLSAKAQNWLTDFEQAKKVAQEKKRKIVLVFQGSDWNGICKRLDREMWKNPEFIKYANNNYVMLKADFPRRKENLLSEEQKEKNGKLLQKYNPDRVFPLVVVLDKEANFLGSTGYKNIEPHQYIELLNFFKGS